MDVQAKIGAFEELAYFCELYPKKRTSEILSEPSIKEYVRVMKTATEEGIRNKQKYYFSKIRDIVYKETSCTKSEAVAFVNDLKDVFINSDKDIGARFYNTRKFARNFLTEQNSKSYNLFRLHYC